jgi:molybdopterin-guanine dinucleotide biosynthesis protein A
VNSAAILAGGQATRFGGRDKSALLVDGRTILDRQIAELAPLTADLLIVGGRDVARPFHVAQGFQPCDRGPERAAPRQAQPRTIVDIVPGCGPLGGLHAALTGAQGDALFVVACDMPYVTSPFIAYLLSLASDADIVVPQSERGYHPLCAVYTRACLEPAAARLADRRLRMLEFVAGMRTRVVPVEDIRRFGDPNRLLTNVNTPAEYAGLHALQGHKL